MGNESEILFYQTEDQQTKIEVRLDGNTVWLSQGQMSELFQTTKQNISLHIKNVFASHELLEASVVKDYLTTAQDNKNYETLHYNLDVIISVGYRVKSHRGVQFRIWATQLLRDYLIKGFAIDNNKLKQPENQDHFQELLEQIRDIRSSEKLFWQKVLAIFALSEDYTKDSTLATQFFTTVQNKMHWAAHGHTAAEIVFARADASKPDMGLTNYTGHRPKKSETHVAKNYLTPEELHTLNLIVSLYLDFAELQAKSRRPMYMKDWITKLNDFLRISDREILTHLGKISHDKAIEKADAEYGKFRVAQANLPSAVERDFEEVIKQTKQIEQQKKSG